MMIGIVVNPSVIFSPLLRSAVRPALKVAAALDQFFKRLAVLYVALRLALRRVFPPDT